MTTRLKRVYDAPEAADGRRVLVDRLWPRGMSHERAALAVWLREIAPTDELRTWYRHRPDAAADFEKRYLRELADEPAAEALAQLRAWADEGVVTLITATRDLEFSHARLLQSILSEGSVPPA
jgi:uncharacterized protein YeaO (DUF488 family)